MRLSLSNKHNYLKVRSCWDEINQMTWEEIEFLENGDIEVEKFISNGEIKGKEALKELFERETASLIWVRV